MNIEKEIKAIKVRNSGVELDKRWETSWARRITICVLTFIIVLIYNYLISNRVNIFLSSAIPVIGFFLSTLSLSYIRKIWEKGSKK